MTTTKNNKEQETMKQLISCLYEIVCRTKEMLEQIQETYTMETEEQSSNSEDPRELIKGISGLAEFLGCGSTKAQCIMNSGVLQQQGIAYRAGNRWRCDRRRLSELLHSNHEIFKDINSEAA
jgi:hypothetical protein